MERYLTVVSNWNFQHMRTIWREFESEIRFL